MQTTYLCHHGILGMKWGVRRYRTEDGKLTDAGKARYNEDGTKKRAKDMSTRELQEANNRLQLEQNYNQMTGHSSASKMFNKDTAVKIGAAAVAAAGTVALTVAVDKYGGNSETTKKILKSVGAAVLTTAAGTVGAGGGKKK